MNSKGPAVATPIQVYEDFVPSSKLVKEEQCDTLHINLPGFKKEQLRVLLTVTGTLKISGQRPIGKNIWQRFQKEFPVAENFDKSKISAKFENGILHVKQPKMITSAVKKDKELAAKEAENTPSAKRQKTALRDEFSKQTNGDINTPAKEPKNNSTKTSEQTEAKSLAEKKLPADESSSSSSFYSESESESTDDEMTGNATSWLAANLKKPSSVVKMTLVALSVLGIGLYVANMMKCANQAEE